MTDPWLPDYVSEWFDAFAREYNHPEIQKIGRGSLRVVDKWLTQLLGDPHGTARYLDAELKKLSGSALVKDRYCALRAASLAFEMGGFFSSPRDYGCDAWDDLRNYWRRSGNLLREGKGLLLPKRERTYPWFPRRNDRRHGPEVYFNGFARVPDELLRDINEVNVRVMVDLVGNAAKLRRRLVIGVAPLIETLEELVFEFVDKEGGRLAYRVAPTTKVDWEARARSLLAEAAAAEVDVLLFPELCFSTATQAAVGEIVRQTAVRLEHPFLVLAGSAHTPVGGTSSDFHNRAIVYDSSGFEVLRHNKLFIYEMSTGEQERYGVAAGFSARDREEDIVTASRRLEVLETPMGRIAVLICEDLSVTQVLLPLVAALELDWLLVSVMDGAQTSWRWTARRAEEYANHGTAVVVVTCRALVEPHRKYAKSRDYSDPGEGIGVVVYPSKSPQILTCAPNSLATFEITQKFAKG
jgi:predicted amidohydrolase